MVTTAGSVWIHLWNQVWQQTVGWLVLKKSAVEMVLVEVKRLLEASEVEVIVCIDVEVIVCIDVEALGQVHVEEDMVC